MIEFCIPPIHPLNFCLLVFKVTAHLSVCKQMQKPKDIVALGVTTPEAVFEQGLCTPLSRLVGVISSDGQSSAWDFSQPQLDVAGDW